MKKLIIALFLAALLTPVFAQNNNQDPERMYYINVPVERVFITGQGYVVQYRSGSSILGTIGIPIEWFGNIVNPYGGITAGTGNNKAEIIQLPSVGDWPTMSVFYKNGEFSHVRLYVHKMKSHITWGSIQQGTDVSRLFGDGQSLDMQY
ncbi:MAG: hypothetical protein FWC21_04970 [Treponema sp.]|nr:hypothetical protein [Treponema sp.]